MTDFAALVIGIREVPSKNIPKSSTNEERSELSVVYLASLRGKDGEEDFSTMAVLRIWGGLEVSLFACLSLPV